MFTVETVPNLVASAHAHFTDKRGLLHLCHGHFTPIFPYNNIYIYPMDPSTFLGSVWDIIYYNLEG